MDFSWKIEKQYCKGVLIGNWFENRFGKVHRGRDFSTSTQKHDYQLYSRNSYNPDISIRRKSLLMNSGLSKSHLFAHHGDQYMHNNIVSTYDLYMNRKIGSGHRQWDRNFMVWLPEAIDQPVIGGNTNFGLKEEKMKKWIASQSMEGDTNFGSSYEMDFRKYPADVMTKRLATPRHLSAQLHPHNVYKNLHFRGKRITGIPEVVDSKLLKLSAAT